MRETWVLSLGREDPLEKEMATHSSILAWRILSITLLASESEVKVKSLSHVQLFGTPWTVAYQAPLSMGFFRQKYWSGLPFPFPGDLPDPGVKPAIPKLEADSLPIESLGKPIFKQYCKLNICYQCVNVSFPFLS